MLARALVLVMMVALPAAAAEYDMSQLFPWPNREFVFDNGESLRMLPWGDGASFTLSHWPTDGAWSPRVDDVFEWHEGRFIYVRTDNQWDGVVTYVGTTWADDVMVAGEVLGETGLHLAIRDGEILHATPMTVWRALREDGGGLRLDHTEVYGDDDWWAEQWFYAPHATLGWIPVGSRGFRRVLGATSLLWDMRLIDIRP